MRKCSFSKEDNSRHLDPPTNAMDTGQPAIFLTGQDVFIFELSILATVSDNSVLYKLSTQKTILSSSVHKIFPNDFVNCSPMAITCNQMVLWCNLTALVIDWDGCGNHSFGGNILTIMKEKGNRRGCVHWGEYILGEIFSDFSSHKCQYSWVPWTIQKQWTFSFYPASMSVSRTHTCMSDFGKHHVNVCV